MPAEKVTFVYEKAAKSRQLQVMIDSKLLDTTSYAYIRRSASALILQCAGSLSPSDRPRRKTWYLSLLRATVQNTKETTQGIPQWISFIGKYELGSWGAFSESAGFQRGYDVGSFGGRLDSVKIFPRETMVEIACVNETASGNSAAVAMEVSAGFEPGPGI